MTKAVHKDIVKHRRTATTEATYTHSQLVDPMMRLQPLARSKFESNTHVALTGKEHEQRMKAAERHLPQFFHQVGSQTDVWPPSPRGPSQYRCPRTLGPAKLTQSMQTRKYISFVQLDEAFLRDRLG
jgi:hypothetical protein